MSISSFSFPTAIRFGAGARKDVGKHLRKRGLQRPLIVTDKALAALPVLKEFRKHLDELDVAVFSGVFGNPTASQAMAGADAFKSHRADCVIGFGGGAALDVAKVVGIAATHEGNIIEYAWDHPKVRTIEQPLPYFVAMPTTSGTGSEVGRAAVVTNEKTHTKKIIFHPKMLPTQTICDPELTVGMPPVITAGTGMDAFSHALEALCVPSYHALADGIAAEGVRLVKENLVTAYKDGTNIEARAHMMAAAAAGATAFQKGLGAIHALSHPVGALYDTHHGLTNAVFAPYVLVFNRRAIEDKVKRLAAYIGLRPSFRAFLDFVLELREQIGIPHTLQGLKVDDSKVDTIVKMAPEDPTAGGNPVKLDRRAARTIFMRALEGRI